MNTAQAYAPPSRIRAALALLLALALLPLPSWCAQPLLWQATAGDASAFLLGSIHFGKPDMYPLDPGVERAFESADRLAVEVDILSADPSFVIRESLRLGTYANGGTLRQHLSEATWQALRAAAARYGLSTQQMDRQRPWLAALALTGAAVAKHGFSESLGVDLHFLRRARGVMPVLELESVAWQIELLAGLSDTDQLWLLEDLLSDLEAVPDHFDQIVAAWAGGDGERLDELLNAGFESSPSARRLFRVLVLDRNVAMADRVQAELERGGTVFVVVGAAHLVGRGSVVEVLRARGYPVTRRR